MLFYIVKLFSINSINYLRILLKLYLIKRFMSFRPRNSKSGVSFISDEHFHSSTFMKGLDLPSRSMSALPDKESDAGDGESVRDGGEETIFDYSSSTIKNHLFQKTGLRIRPKLASAQAVLSSKLEQPLGTREERDEPLSRSPEEMVADSEVEEKQVKERVTADEALQEDSKNEATRKNLCKSRTELKEKLKDRMRERLGGCLDNIDESSERQMADSRRHRQRSWVAKQRHAHTSRDGELYMEKDGEERDGGMKEFVPHPVLSRVLLHSSASSSSSFNNSSAESDEVFSEGEDAAARRKTMSRVSGILGKATTI